ncbi:5,10-methylenetetrahydrofolate reductase [Planctomycetes bacterium CA13]|uniref:Methylenetetrahydrofolate reductase n=1 Tax=Novipirellula herctigrandis TaxID=2527986 RepID=A0A5C5YXL8_9BACT|nr:5,10-methylenetetrahydrofolate reductase [Planctomycetes bacterium CA13]
MTLVSHYKSSRCAISFELFPPKTAAGMDALAKSIEQLNQFSPSYFTCTYGAGGSTRDTTLDVVEKVKELTGLPVASHLTCVGSTVEQLESFLQDAASRSVDYIVALRGDPPQGSDQFEAVEGGFRYANELVELIHDRFPQFSMAVAGYPEVHQEATSAKSDLENLKRKVDAGADIIITQLFYNNDDFYRFRDACVAEGISVPIIPGILPVTNFKQAERIASMCKAEIPSTLAKTMSQNDDPKYQFNVGVDHARNQTLNLIENQVEGIHYYVLNKSEAAAKLLNGLELAAG